MCNKHVLNRLIELSQKWMMTEALWVLWTLRRESSQLLWRGFWTVASSVVSGTAPLTLARNVEVSFNGGPGEGQGDEYTGPFSMFVLDTVLRMNMLDGTSPTWLLWFDPAVNIHIADQLERFAPNGGYENRKFEYFGEDGLRDYADWVDSYEDEPVADYVQVGDKIIPITESGRQIAVVNGTDYDGGAVSRWSSSGQIVGCGGL